MTCAAMATKRSEHESRKVVDTLGPLRLRRFNDNLAVEICCGAADLYRARIEVEVVPLERTQLGTAQPGADRRRDDPVELRGGGGFEKALYVFNVDNNAFDVNACRRCNVVGHAAREVALLDAPREYCADRDQEVPHALRVERFAASRRT